MPTLEGNCLTARSPVLRSRRLLMESLARLLTKKEFEDIFVQEIAEEETLNRPTFNLHHTDKKALLGATTDFRIRSLIEPKDLLSRL
jgi:hypothetical protein